MKTLKNIRESKGVSKKAVFTYLGISQPTYDFYEDHPEKMRIETAKKVASFLGVKLGDIFFLSNSK